MLLVQFKNEQGARHVGVLEQNTIRIIDGYSTTYALAQDAIRKSVGLAALADKSVGVQTAAFDAVAAAGRLLSPLDHTDDRSVLWSVHRFRSDSVARRQRDVLDLGSARGRADQA